MERRSSTRYRDRIRRSRSRICYCTKLKISLPVQRKVLKTNGISTILAIVPKSSSSASSILLVRCAYLNTFVIRIQSNGHLQTADPKSEPNIFIFYIFVYIFSYLDRNRDRL